MEGVNPEIARVFVAKEDRRQRLARLPFPEKVHVVIKLQEMVATILSTRGKSVKPWRIATDGAEDSPKNR